MQSSTRRKVAASQGPAALLCPALQALGAPIWPCCHPCCSMAGCSAGQESSAAEPLVWPGTGASQRDRAISHAAGEALGPATPKHPCAPFTRTETVPWTGGGSGTVFAQCQMCSGHRDLSAALGRQEQGPAQPWLSPGSGCARALAVPGLCPQQGAINHAPASAALPQPLCPRSCNQHWLPSPCQRGTA